MSIPATPEAVRFERLAAVFLATPAEVSLELAPAMLEAGVKVIDLSGAFRLRTAERYEQWYKAAHTQPALLAGTTVPISSNGLRRHLRVQGPRGARHVQPDGRFR